VNNNFSFI